MKKGNKEKKRAQKKIFSIRYRKFRLYARFQRNDEEKKPVECEMKMFSRPVDFHDHLFDGTHLHQVFSLH